jgi:hypothetical protein
MDEVVERMNIPVANSLARSQGKLAQPNGPFAHSEIYISPSNSVS